MDTQRDFHGTVAWFLLQLWEIQCEMRVVYAYLQHGYNLGGANLAMGRGRWDISYQTSHGITTAPYIV